MENANASVAGTVEERGEEWFLARLAESPIPVDTLLVFLEQVRERGRGENAADAWADLLQQALVDRQATMDALRVMRLRASWKPELGNASWKDAVLRLVEAQPEKAAFVQYAGFDQRVSPAECIRRLIVLLRLEPDLLVLEKSWGFGVVRNVDMYYSRVEIDFDSKPQHKMSLAYAAETLNLIGAEHVLAKAHREPEVMQQLVRENPADIVRMALRSYGPLTVPQLQSVVIPKIVSEGGWKSFWDGARKVLKKDPLIEIPSKRTEPLRLLKKARAYDEDWFAKLHSERDMPKVLQLVDEVVQNPELMQEPAFRAVTADRIAFVIKGAGRRQAGLGAKAVMYASELGLDQEIEIAAKAADYMQPARFLETATALPARDVKTFILFLARIDKDRTVDLLLELLTKMNLVTLTESIDFLLASGAEERCAEVVRTTFLSQKTEVELLYWLSRNLDRLEKWSLGTLVELSQFIVADMSNDYMGDRLRVQNTLRSRFESREWLKGMLDAMDERQRRDIVFRIKDSDGWSVIDRQGLLGQLVKLDGNLQQYVATRESDSPSMNRGPQTSIRSYWQRQAQYAKLVNVDIPENSKEIAVARSYGDLSENHEYKAAKEMQGILLRRRAEMESMLQRVKPSDFRGLQHERAGLATTVVLEYEGGQTEQFHILGEWDQDAERGIISCNSRMAQALEGHKAGEEVLVPTESGDAKCILKSVSDLPDDIREWIEKM